MSAYKIKRKEVKKIAKEKNFENKIKKFLKDQDCYFIKYWGGGQFTKSGVRDLLICCNGYFVAVEVKAEDGKPSDLQLWNIEQIKKAGGFAMVLYPNQFEEFKKFIISMKNVIDNNKMLLYNNT